MGKGHYVKRWAKGDTSTDGKGHYINGRERALCQRTGIRHYIIGREKGIMSWNGERALRQWTGKGCNFNEWEKGVALTD